MPFLPGCVYAWMYFVLLDLFPTPVSPGEEEERSMRELALASIPWDSLVMTILLLHFQVDEECNVISDNNMGLKSDLSQLPPQLPLDSFDQIRTSRDLDFTSSSPSQFNFCPDFFHSLLDIPFWIIADTMTRVLR